MESSEYTPVAVNWTGAPTGTLGLDGVTPMVMSVAIVTVMLAVLEIPAKVAVTVTGPWLRVAALPFAPAAPVNAAIAVFEDVHVTSEVRFWVDWSEKVPVAVNWAFRPLAILGLPGVTARDTRVAEVTVKEVEPDTPLSAAVIRVEPAATALASPKVPVTLLTVATLAVAELQVTRDVRSCFEPSV